MKKRADSRILLLYLKVEVKIDRNNTHCTYSQYVKYNIQGDDYRKECALLEVILIVSN